MSNFYTLKVSEKEKAASDSVIITFEVPDTIRPDFEFVSGQYLTIKADINGESIRRSYSICSAPHEEKISIGVKKIAGGKMSSFLNDMISKGDTLEVMTPEGKFVVNTEDHLEREHYFIAAGSGITPVLSMIKAVLESEPLSKCYLYYGNRNEDSIMFKDELDRLADYYKGQLEVRHTLSKPTKMKASGLKGIFGMKTTAWKGEEGRIDIAKFINFLELYPPKLSEQHYYICGPAELIMMCEEILKEKEIPKGSIHREYFTTPDSKKESVSGKDGAKLIATINEDVYETTISKGKTVLDALIDIKANPPYSCTSGACSSCIAKVVKGAVEMEVSFALDKDEIDQGYILTCQAHPTTSELEIVYDEVDELKEG